MNLSIESGERVKVVTRSGAGETHVMVTEHQRPGFIGLPNGLGIDYIDPLGQKVKVGIAPNELTSSDNKDFFAGTPWHKYVPARIEKLSLT